MYLPVIRCGLIQTSSKYTGTSKSYRYRSQQNLAYSKGEEPASHGPDAARVSFECGPRQNFVKCATRESNRLRYRPGSGSRNFIFNGLVPVRFGFSCTKIWRFGFGSDSSKPNF